MSDWCGKFAELSLASGGGTAVSAAVAAISKPQDRDFNMVAGLGRGCFSSALFAL